MRNTIVILLACAGCSLPLNGTGPNTTPETVAAPDEAGAQVEVPEASMAPDDAPSLVFVQTTDAGTRDDAPATCVGGFLLGNLCIAGSDVDAAHAAIEAGPCVASECPACLAGNVPMCMPTCKCCEFGICT